MPLKLEGFDADLEIGFGILETEIDEDREDVWIRGHVLEKGLLKRHQLDFAHTSFEIRLPMLNQPEEVLANGNELVVCQFVMLVLLVQLLGDVLDLVHQFSRTVGVLFKSEMYATLADVDGVGFGFEEHFHHPVSQLCG